MPATRKPPTRFNTIGVVITPNPLYISGLGKESDKTASETTSLAENQIAGVEIIKSYKTHKTEIKVMLKLMDPTVISNLMDGKMVVLLTISPFSENMMKEATINGAFFVRAVLDVESDEVIGTFPTVKATLVLKSITRTRMDLENNIPALTTGKVSFAGMNFNSKYEGLNSSKPFDYFRGVIEEMLNTAYTVNASTVAASGSIVDYSRINASPGSPFLIASNPQNYIIESDNNFKAISDFFDKYPPWLSPFNWMLDECPLLTSDKLQTAATYIHILDLIDINSWGPFNTQLSSIIDGTAFEKGKDQKLETLSGYAYLDFYEKERNSVYSLEEFIISESNPYIVAEHMINGTPIDTRLWNDKAINVEQLVVNGASIHTKIQPNPRIKFMSTFMTADEIVKNQALQTFFMQMHPELVKYNFSNAHISDVSINEPIFLDTKNMDESHKYETGHRAGVCYEIKYSLYPVKTTPALMELKKKISSTTSYQDYNEPKFVLDIDASFLLVDTKVIKNVSEIPTSGIQYDNVEALVAGSLYDPCNTPNAIPVTDADISNLPGSPNGSAVGLKIAAGASHYLGVPYVWNGKTSSGLDCSGLVVLALRDAGVDMSGLKPTTSRGTRNIYNWLSNPAYGEKIQLSEIQTGDIVFFNNDFGHVGIYNSGGKIYEASSVQKKVVDNGNLKRKAPVTAIFRVKADVNTPNTGG